mmetsp:Transcript_14919/g.60849  ORF Transcript_14919/g.60849 Transcript_14919/m.60849 type:complete len:233 (-) Transcript_14919:87-785(-)
MVDSDQITAELELAVKRAGVDDEDAVPGPGLEEAFAATESSDHLEKEKKKRLNFWKHKTASSDASKQASEALKASLAKFTSSMKGASQNQDKGFLSVGNTLSTYYPAPATSPLGSSSIDVLVKYLKQWKDRLNPANIESQNEREFGNTIAIGKNAGVVLECLTRSSSESLSKRSTAIAQISEDVLKIGCRWLAKLNKDLKASTGTARLCGGVLPGKFFFGFTEADSVVSCLR